MKRIYYQIKPYLPWQFRMLFRRRWASMRRKACRETWPIFEAAARPPSGWHGWPDGKKFAFVLTHDVERTTGLHRCRQLMDVEMDRGLRSSFNFVPEGEYELPDDLRRDLRQNGFEVGVHDLHHDGKLYFTRRGFFKRAERINHYLEEWGATGFRSAYMLHNLDWLRALKISYDASTFDSDPFEPQPSGAHTIFPFWVPRGTNGNGFVELPYTLAQDFTLFVLFKEPSIDIWRRKLDWIAEHGGMALVNVHPDYMNPSRSQSARHEYPATLYEQFLDYVQNRYANQFWHALPREVTDFWNLAYPKISRPASRRVCMVSFSAYESDNRVMRYAEALAARNDSVDVLGVKSNPAQPSEETMEGVRVHRLQVRGSKDKQTKNAYLFPLLRFWLRVSFWLMRRQMIDRYDLIHVHNVPDFLVFAAWLPKLAGAKIILDIHDIVPEFFANKFRTPDTRFEVRLLKVIERLSARFADHVIISNHLWRDKYVARSAAPEKCSVILNHVDRSIFYRRDRTRNDGRFVILFPGGLQWHQGVDIAIRGFSRIQEQLPNAEFHIYGDGNMKLSLIKLSQELGLNSSVKFFPPVGLRQIAEIMATADVGVVPKRADSFGNEAFSTKIMEFMALGVPVVASKTRIDRFYFDDSIIKFFESGNETALAKAVVAIASDRIHSANMIAKARDYVERNSWDTKKGEYFRLVDRLCSERQALTDLA